MSINCMQEKDDIELLCMTQSGDMKAFECLFKRYHQKALNISFRTVGSIELSEDIVMESFIKIHNSNVKIKSNFKSYFYKIVLNTSINYIKKNKRFINDIDLNMLSSGKNNPMEEAMNKEEIKDAWLALNSLPLSQKTAFVLVKYEELTYKEASEIMGISVKALESLMARAKENLKKYYFGGEKC